MIFGRSALATSVARDLADLGLAVVFAPADQPPATVLEDVACDAIVFAVDHMRDWILCGEVAAIADCPLVVVTRFLARDRRYRDFAFNARVTAYLHPPWTRRQLADLLRRMQGGERSIEIIGCADVSAHAGRGGWRRRPHEGGAGHSSR